MHGMMDERVRALNDRPVRAGGGYILYWCRWNRRVESNHALLYAARLANRMGLPLVCFERLSCAYPTACDRFHTFVLEGVAEFEAGCTNWAPGTFSNCRAARHAAMRDARGHSGPPRS